MPGAYHWLVANGLYRDILAAAVATITGFLLGRLLTLRPLRALRARQDHIARQLDTATPGGLGDVTDMLRQLLAASRSKAGREDTPGPGGLRWNPGPCTRQTGTRCRSRFPAR